MHLELGFSVEPYVVSRVPMTAVLEYPGSSLVVVNKSQEAVYISDKFVVDSLQHACRI